MENQNPIKFSDCVKGPRNVGSIPKKKVKRNKNGTRKYVTEITPQVHLTFSDSFSTELSVLS